MKAIYDACGGPMDEKWQQMDAGLKKHLQGCRIQGTPGSFSFWIELPKAVSGKALVKLAAENSIIVESGDSFFKKVNPAHNYIRLGFTAIAAEKIEPGLALLGSLVQKLADDAGSAGIPE